MILELHNVTVIYPDKTKALDNINFKLDEGESIALIGENGAGKTSLLHTLVGLIEPESGRIEMDNILSSKKTMNEIRKKVGLVFQNPDNQLFMPFIYDDIAFGCRNSGLHEDEIKNLVDKIINLLNISHLRNRSSLKLSGGEKRIAAIATVLIMNPSILAFDEPTAFLDHKSRRTLINTLNTLPQAKIIVTHDLSFASEVCTRVLVLKNGKIAADGGLSVLYNNELLNDCGLEAIKI